jgi:multiple sugar transport system permease protein
MTWRARARRYRRARKSCGSSSPVEVLFSLVNTGALIAIVPLIIAYLMLRRYWHTELTASSVKQ